MTEPDRIDTSDVRAVCDFIDGHDLPAAALDATAAWLSVTVRTDPDLGRWRAVLSERWQRVDENRGISGGRSLVAILTATGPRGMYLPDIRVTLVRPVAAADRRAAS